MQLSSTDSPLSEGNRFSLRLLRPLDGSSAGGDRLSGLSPRERQAFFHVVAGKTIKETAAAMSVREKTAENYRARVLAKISVRNAAEAVHFAVIHGLLVNESDPALFEGCPGNA